jgi:hypothetical protein
MYRWNSDDIRGGPLFKELYGMKIEMKVEEK